MKESVNLKAVEYSQLIGEKNEAFKMNVEFCGKTFVGHRFGTHFFDMDIRFEKSNKQSLKRKLYHENGDMENETKRKKRAFS